MTYLRASAGLGLGLAWRGFPWLGLSWLGSLRPAAARRLRVLQLVGKQLHLH